jgi:2-oxoisovalerate dehydrogenase E1 component
MNNSHPSSFKNELIIATKIRLVEERLLSLFSEGKLNGTVHTAVGQEFTGVFVSKYLGREDFVTSNHRGHGHYLARFNNVKGLIAELMGKVGGVSGGMGGSQHIVDENYLSNGIQGGMLPIAAGVAYYNKLAKNNAISVSYIGDGTLGEGLVYETLNLASVYALPMLVVIENNGIAQSTSMKQSFRGDIENRVKGFGWEYRKTNTRDLEQLDHVVKDSVGYVRNQQKPLFIEIETYRLNSHSKGDDNRKKAEIEELKRLDLISNLLENGESEFLSEVANIRNEIDAVVDEVMAMETLVNSAFGKTQINSLPKLTDINLENQSTERYNTLIYQSLKTYLSQNEKSLLIGEDIQNKSEFTESDYGGAFKVTRDLSDFFPNRVLNSPISEGALFGFASGYAMKAGRSFAEIMFGDFTTLVFDQVLQHASKFHAMYNGKVSCPVVLRTPMGGKRGYGPTHSQSIEKHFLGIDNFCIVALHHRIDPHYIYEALNKFAAPVMLVENKILYTLSGNKRKVVGYNYQFSDHLFPILKITPSKFNPIATLLCYGEVLNEAEDALFELMVNDEFFCEIICPTLISEITIQPIIDSVRITKKLIIVEEGSGFASWGSEVVSALVCAGIQDFELYRWSNENTIPSSFQAELNLLPTRDKIVKLIKKGTQ